MRVGVFESIVTSGGHEHDFDKMLVEELTESGYETEMVVPENYPFKLDYGVAVREIPGEAVSYSGVSGVKKLVLSAEREWKRIGWFNSLSRLAEENAYDVFIVPTATYRFLRSARLSRLTRSTKPVIFLIHGINPGEAARFLRQVEALEKHPHIRVAVISMSEDIFGKKPKNLITVLPPIYPPPRGLDLSRKQDSVLTLGFFGQYRREKNLDAFLDVYRRCRFTVPVRLLVQGATTLPEDAADFQRIQRKYGEQGNISFLHKALIGNEWQEAIAGIDALIMPYANERYRYHWSAMLFTAIGYHKPVVVSDSINPEVLTDFDMGVSFSPKDTEGLQQALERFVNTFPEKQARYQDELGRANKVFSPAGFVRTVLGLTNVQDREDSR